MTLAIPVMDEAHARARLDALMCEHGLPFERAHWLAYDAEFLAIATQATPFVQHVSVPNRADVAVWAAVLGVRAITEHTIHEYDDGQWCAVWTEVVRVCGWLPDVKLSVAHTEIRWIGAS